MKNPRIIIADEDYTYSCHLQQKFAEELFGKAELEIITDRTYFESLFSEPQAADVLIVSRELFFPGLSRHHIGCGFVLTESGDPEMQTEEAGFRPICRYSSIWELFDAVKASAEGLTDVIRMERESPFIVAVTSAAGGTGKTTAAIGTAAALAKRNKKVLYINIDYLQHFGTLLDDRTPILDEALYRSAVRGSLGLYDAVKPFIRTEIFDYVPPFRRALGNLGLDHAIGTELAEQACRSGAYDLVIADADSTFDRDKMRLLSAAGQILLVTTQAEDSVSATNDLLDNLDRMDRKGIRFICNRFDPHRENALPGSGNDLLFGIDVYIREMEDYGMMKKNKFSGCEEMRKISALII